ncbi:MAG: segregation/condensation protein A [Bacillota bacterium]|nr:segregation/condensation protein A [Bacillota bacterium]
MEYIVNLNKFQGPFDLLFHLIEEHEIEIYDIPISEITEQYISYLDKMVEYSMDVTSEFILMASTLIEIKSRMLLPTFTENEEDDPRQDLVNRLIEYKLFKNVSEEFRDREEEELKFLPKPKEEVEYDFKFNEQILFEEINVYDLLNSINSLLKRRKIEIGRESPKFNIRYDEYSVTKCIQIIKNILKEKPKVSLLDIFKIDFNKGFIIAIFLSILEMSRDNKIKIIQDNLFEDIYLISK